MNQKITTKLIDSDELADILQDFSRNVTNASVFLLILHHSLVVELLHLGINYFVDIISGFVIQTN